MDLGRHFLARVLQVEFPGVHSPRLAANLSYRRTPDRGQGQAPISRKQSWIPCQARNDGPGEKTIPGCLRRGSSVDAWENRICFEKLSR